MKASIVLISIIAGCIAISAGFVIWFMMIGHGRPPSTNTIIRTRELAAALIHYTADHDGRWPVNATEGTATTIDAEDFNLNFPGGASLNPNGASLLFNPYIAHIELTDIPSASSTVMLFESAAWPDGKVTVAFADGSVRRVSVQELVIRLIPPAAN